MIEPKVHGAAANSLSRVACLTLGAFCTSDSSSRPTSAPMCVFAHPRRGNL
jgi:hypothetical protein